MAIQQGTGFTNLQKLIGANQNNQLGNTIQSGINKNVSNLQNNVNSSQQQFQNDVNNANQNTSGNQQYAQGVINSVVNPPASSTANAAAPQGQTPTNQVASSQNAQQQQTQTPTVTDSGSSSNGSSSFEDANATPPASGSSQQGSGYGSSIWGAVAPTDSNAAAGSFGDANSDAASGENQTQNSFAPSGSDVQKFGQLLGGGYMGPNQLNNYASLQAQGQNLANQGQNLNTSGGLQSLLQQYVGGRNYNQGEQGLDTLILGQTGQPQLKNVANTLRNVNNIPSQAESQAEGLAQQTAAGNQQFSQDLRNSLTSAQNPILQNIQQSINGLNQKNTNSQTVGKQIYDMLNNPNPTNTSSSGGLTNHIGGGGAAPTTNAGVAQNALQTMLNSGVIDQATYDNVTSRIFATNANIGGLDQALAPHIGNYYMPQSTYDSAIQEFLGQAQAGIGDPKSILAQNFSYNPNAALPQYTLQQGANAQQAAQLQALAQLGGQQGQFGTYGGATPISNSLNTANIPQVYNLDPGTIDYDLTKYLGANHNGKA